MITVVDYGSGNLRSVSKALEKVGGDVTVSARPEDVAAASHIVLPGVGAFADCRRNLDETGLTEPVLAHIEAGKPFFGICVGMQMLFSEGHEFGVHPGLGLIPGSVVGFPTDMPDPADDTRLLKVPHMGWSRVKQAQKHPLWNGIDDKSFFYFVHSFHGRPDDLGHMAGTAMYGAPFTAAVARDNLFATQFHPEKSQNNGLKLLENFISWRP
ncbi:imidazole glycerol phosphate synthase subunit HisH [Magnetofaba australis]|uniref:Imidazole glycerol phosphate synthase subunit HisH n=1 Tax=Magnetofaba australis IT-1 TaxID=1434232 RepID=A0A1Y2K1Z5_9PROT|nr:imidazole glycerol phosphate synthase subunit HisH [Magnetofaba australis]OSM02038.1 putative imidazole glycerol phosphate synthase subunit HisH [Magnetofaba australis IT-1]